MALSKLADALRCPETRLELKVAPRELVERLRSDQSAGRLFYKSGGFVTVPFEGGLIRQDGAIFYPVRKEIPILLCEEAIVVTKS